MSKSTTVTASAKKTGTAKGKGSVKKTETKPESKAVPVTTAAPKPETGLSMPPILTHPEGKGKGKKVKTPPVTEIKVDDSTSVKLGNGLGEAHPAAVERIVKYNEMHGISREATLREIASKQKDEMLKAEEKKRDEAAKAEVAKAMEAEKLASNGTYTPVAKVIEPVKNSTGVKVEKVNNRYQIYGISHTKIVMWMGSQGWSVSDVQASFKTLGLPEISVLSIRCFLRAGKSAEVREKENRGDLPVLTKEWATALTKTKPVETK